MKRAEVVWMGHGLYVNQNFKEDESEKVCPLFLLKEVVLSTTYIRKSLKKYKVSVKLYTVRMKLSVVQIV